MKNIKLQQAQELLALLRHNEMWLSTPGGKDDQKCNFREHTESRECSWLPGSQ